jgi:hypothetical protein
MKQLKQRAVKLHWQIIPRADHYFLLSDEEAMQKIPAGLLSR